MQLLGFDSGSFRPDDFVKSMPIFAAMLTASDRYRRWVVGGEVASSDGDTIHLPGIKMKSPREAAAFLGYALHELSHRWTDFEIFKQTTTPFHQWLTNALEDVYTDKKQHVVHPGAKPILDQLAGYMVEEGLEPQPDVSMPHTQLIQCYIQYRLRNSVLGEEAYGQIADEAERLVSKILPAGVLAKLRALMFEVANCDDSWAVLEVSKSILGMFEDAKEQDPPTPADGSAGADGASDTGGTDGADGSADAGGTDGADGSADAGGTDGADGSAGADGAAGSDGTAGSDGADGSVASQETSVGLGAGAMGDLADGSRGQGGDGSANAGAGAGSGGADDQVGAASPAASQADGAPGSEVGDYRSVIANLLQMTSEEAMKGIGDQMKDMVNGIAQEQLATGEFDPSLWYTPSDSVVQDDPSVSGIAEMDRVSGSVNALRVRLNALLQARTRSTVSYKDSGRKLAVARLSRLSYGDSRVFKVKSRGIDIDTAVLTLGDRSVSMKKVVGNGRSRLDFALDVLLALSMALDSIKGIQHSVAAFPGADDWVDGRQQSTIDVLKRWREPTKQVVTRYNRVKPSGGTPAHIALVWAGQELMKVRAARKIIFMATDGEPDEPGAVRDAVHDLRRLGVEVIGVGLGVDVSHLFDAFVRVDAIDELAGAVFGLMRDRLLAA
ncbi:hypothetical protein [Duganella vulcania]|uniref:VWFA domain-containing protein n=1 Tax=Duganella vulcania TaxID=2692166 RepID=A0A845GH31_9BURK|nr:hypothetical protein [Duganella vulcania]MYM92732.1 hypothetical protein [Duganella vulcania]